MCSVNTIFLVFIIFNFCNFIHTLSKQNLTIVMSYDAFYYKYFDRNITPTLGRLREEGTKAKYMMNIFPTKTFPNHFTIATGRFAEEHGVLENHLFDPILNKSIGYSEELFTWNKNILPIWILNEQAGNDRHSGVMMWPGSEYFYNGTKATFSQGFNSSIPFEARVDEAIKWILHPTTPANLIFLYFEEPDTHGHAYGPNSEHVNGQIIIDDKTTKYLLDKLKINNISNYDLVILSDHGMSPVPYENIIDLRKILKNDTYNYYGTSPTLSVLPKNGEYDNVLNRLKEAASKKDSHFKVFAKNEIPDMWRYKNNVRALPILLLADNGYVFNDIYKTMAYFSSAFNITYGPGSVLGAHGYDPSDDNMHPFFLAHGPSFKEKHEVSVFNNIDLFSFFAHLLQLKISPDSHSGNFMNVQDIFKEYPERGYAGSVSRISVFLEIIFVVILEIIIVVICYVCYRLVTRSFSKHFCNCCSSNSTVEVNDLSKRTWSSVEYSTLRDYRVVVAESDDNST